MSRIEFPIQSVIIQLHGCEHVDLIVIGLVENTHYQEPPELLFSNWGNDNLDLVKSLIWDKTQEVRQFASIQEAEDWLISKGNSDWLSQWVQCRQRVESWVKSNVHLKEAQLGRLIVGDEV